MTAISRWSVALRKQKALWDCIVYLDSYILGVFFDNFAKPANVRTCFSRTLEPHPQFEISSFRIGIRPSALETRDRLCVVPLTLLRVENSNAVSKSNEEIHRYLYLLYSENRCFIGYGIEETALDYAIEFMLFYHIIKYSSVRYSVSRKITQTSKPGGMLFLDVGTLSLLGSADRYSSTGYAHSDGILVTTRLHHTNKQIVIRKLQSSGMRFRERGNHIAAGNLIGRARDSTFLEVK
jgi:hypothetical protein